MSKAISTCLAILLCAAAILPAAAQTTTVNGIIDYDEAKAFVRTINKARRDKGLNTLKLEQGLTEAAVLRAAELSTQWTPFDKASAKGSDTRPNGKKFNTLVEEKYPMPSESTCGELVICCVSSHYWLSGYRKKLDEEDIIFEPWKSVGLVVFHRDEYTYCVILFSNHTNETSGVPSGQWKTKIQVGTTSGKKTSLLTKEQGDSLDLAHKVEITGSFYYDFATEVVRIVNVLRDSFGLAPLTMDSVLTECAMLRSAENATSNGLIMQNRKFSDSKDFNTWFISHTCPTGERCFTILPEKYDERGKGENIGMGHRTPQDVVADWMTSPGHRANILDKSYKAIGVGAFFCDNNLNWTQMFTTAPTDESYHPDIREEVTVQVAILPDTESKVVKRKKVE